MTETIYERVEGPSLRFAASRNANRENICVKMEKQKHKIEPAITYRYPREGDRGMLIASNGTAVIVGLVDAATSMRP